MNRAGWRVDWWAFKGKVDACVVLGAWALSSCHVLYRLEPIYRGSSITPAGLSAQRIYVKIKLTIVTSAGT